MPTLTMNLRDFRQDPAQRTWELPPWGHPLSKCVLPLFIQANGRYLPIGTAFWVGPKVQFILTAVHNIEAALRHEPRLEHLRITGQWPERAKLTQTGLSVLHQDFVTTSRAHISLTPLETINGGPPGDVAFGHPQFRNGRGVVHFPLSFCPPRIGETIWSVGYTDFAPADGVPVEAVADGTYDWEREYRHRFIVAEARVERIFTQRFDHGYLRGPCFVFDCAIEHGQSGGPLLSERGAVVGINSCDVSIRFNKPASLGSMLYPLLLHELDFGLTVGGGDVKVNFKGRRPLVDLVRMGVISSDRSEENVGFHRTEGTDGFSIGPVIHRDDRNFVHNDFHGFQAGHVAEPHQGDVYRLRRESDQSNEASLATGGRPALAAERGEAD